MFELSKGNLFVMFREFRYSEIPQFVRFGTLSFLQNVAASTRRLFILSSKQLFIFILPCAGFNVTREIFLVVLEYAQLININQLIRPS